MRDTCISSSQQLSSDVNATRTNIICFQVSADGCHTGMVYRVEADSSPKQVKVFVKITDLRRFTDEVKYVTSLEDAAEIEEYKYRFKLNADLSMLLRQDVLYDLSSATVDVMATQFSGSVGKSFVDQWRKIRFSSCNHFIACFDSRDVKFYQICRCTKTLVELSVRGAQFSSGEWCDGSFHPQLPILVLCAIVRKSDDRIDSCEMIAVNLSRLEAFSLQLPRSV